MAIRERRERHERRFVVVGAESERIPRGPFQLHLRFQHRGGIPLLASGPGSGMAPTGMECGGPGNIDQSCFMVFDAAATESRLCLSGYWCDAAGVCEFATCVHGPGHTLLGSIPAYGPVAVDPEGAVYVVTSAHMIEKWTPSGATPTARSSWGALKARRR